MTATHVDTDLGTIEGIDFDADVRCEGMWPDADCDAIADLLVRTHTHRGFPVCRRCWVEAALQRGICGKTGAIEQRDEHSWIVQGLR